jgi:hypothetical protein
MPKLTLTQSCCPRPFQRAASRLSKL